MIDKKEKNQLHDLLTRLKSELDERVESDEEAA
jgi:hypothetical protein